jgi:hypothetical protein
MCGKVSCAGSGQLYSTIYRRTFSDFHSLPPQNSFCSINHSTTTIADAPGLSSDCHYQPRLVEGWQSLEAGRSRAVGSTYRDQSVGFFNSSL